MRIRLSDGIRPIRRRRRLGPALPPDRSILRRSRRRNGFTLTEVMFTVFLLLAAAVGASAFLANMLRAANFAERATAARLLAQDKVEELIAEKLSDVTGGSDAQGPYTRTWTVANATNDMLIMTVNVTWADIDGTTQAVTSTSALAD